MGTGGVASVHLGKGRYAYSTDTWAIRIKESSKLTQPYAYRVLELSLPKIDYAGFEGSGLRHLRKSYIKDFRFLAPSDSAPQKQIVSILTGIDTAIENTEALIAKYQQIKAGLMHDLFTRGVLPNGQLRPPREQAPELYQETAIGWIPRDWECQRLGLILSKSGGYLQTGPFGSQLHAAEYKDEGVPVVMPQDINDGSIQTTSIARISEARAASLARHRLKVGDIIIARRGELSRAAAVGHAEVEWICGTGCFLLRLGRTELNHFFFSHVYRHDFVQRQVAGMQVGSTMPSLNNDVMSRLFFPFPSSAEQGEITQRLDLAEQKISALQDELSKLKQQKQGLMHDLLTGKVPVTIENRTTTTEAVV
ncbi:MAG: restriction endonuclease subunit S [Rhodocyclaceae bacterium]|nr:restriction endonuclease subunit S [Rhodocyclaceae bacterium]